MDASLNDVYAQLVKAPDRAKRIEATDAQLKMYRVDPENYILPNSYKWMTPILEAFGFDMEGWMHFQRDIIENFGKRSDERMELHAVYRRVNSRVDAIIRRERLDRAVKVHSETHHPFMTRGEELEYAKNLHRIWKLNRMNVIAKYRQDRGLSKIPADEKAELCDTYWGTIRAELDAGKAPREDSLRGLLKEAESLNMFYYGKKS